MDWNLLVLGSVPPGLAIIAEILNPVEIETVKDQAKEHVDTHVKGWVADEKEQARGTAAICDIVGKSASGAIEASALVPTWISVTAAFATTTAAVFPLLSCAVSVAIWALLSAVIVPKFFANVNYYALADRIADWRICGGKTAARCLSSLLILANGFVIVIVLAVACDH